MAGVREKKKARTQEAILHSANDLFNEKGFNETTVEEIAERAEVGVGTVYNYFGSKRGVLIALGAQVTGEIIEKGAELIESATGRPEESLSRLFGLYLEFTVRFDPKLVRELMATAFMEPEEVGKELIRLDYMLIAQVGEMLKKFQDLGEIDKDLPLKEASLILYFMLGMLVIMYVEGIIDSPETMKETISSHISLIFRSWRG